MYGGAFVCLWFVVVVGCLFLHHASTLVHRWALEHSVYILMKCLCVCTHNLQFDSLAIQLDGADLKVHPNGADVAFCVGIILNRDQNRTELG